MVYVRGLSPNSATVTKLQSQRQMGRAGKDVNVVRGPKNTQTAFEALFKPPEKSG